MDAPKQKSLKETHPQKYYLKLICQWIYYMGIGDCWYEETVRSKTHKILYGIWATILNTFIVLNTLNQMLANFRSDLMAKERSDLLQFTFAHPCLCTKYITLIFQKERVRVLFKRMLEDSRSLYFSHEVDKASVRKAILYATTTALITYGAVFLALVDGIRAYFAEGIPIRTEVVFYPASSDSGAFITFLRIIVETHWWFIVTDMLLVDTLCVFTLIYLGYKFKLVRIYFDNLGKKTLNNIGTKSKLALRDDFEKDFKLGITLHEDALWCSRNVQYAIGNLYSVQVFESITLLVMCLIRWVVTERSLIFFISIMTYIVCLFVLSAAYFTAAGDITNQASKVCTSIFHCGWETIPMSKSLKSMIVIAIQRSQVPVYMTSFGVIILSHSNLISLLRSSYSFFAVMY